MRCFPWDTPVSSSNEKAAEVKFEIDRPNVMREPSISAHLLTLHNRAQTVGTPY